MLPGYNDVEVKMPVERGTDVVCQIFTHDAIQSLESLRKYVETRNERGLPLDPDYMKRLLKTLIDDVEASPEIGIECPFEEKKFEVIVDGSSGYYEWTCPVCGTDHEGEIEEPEQPDRED